MATARVGDRLPSERDLSVRWGVARMTIRAATDALVAEGLVERRRGSGTYVVPRPFARVLGLTSFTQDMAARGIVALRARPGGEQRRARAGGDLGSA